MVKALSWEHVRDFGGVAGLLVAFPGQRSLVRKYPPLPAA